MKIKLVAGVPLHCNAKSHHISTNTSDGTKISENFSVSFFKYFSSFFNLMTLGEERRKL